MTNKILLFEGYDGSGKTTLIENFEKFLKEKGKTCLLVGRDYNRPINTITEIIKDKESEINPTSEILLRLARETERVKILNQNLDNYDYIILDRSVVSATSWVKFYNQTADKYTDIVSEIVNAIGSCHLVYCFLPFEDTWERVNSRPDKPLSKKEEKGKETNAKMFEALRQTFLDFNFPTVNKIEIKTHQTREECISNLLTELNLNDTTSDGQ